MSLYKDASLVMIPSAYKDGKLYSIRPTDGSGDFTFSRGSNLAATRVDVNGLIEKGRENLLLQSNQFDTTWSENYLVRTSGQSGYDGSNDAWKLQGFSGTAEKRIRQSTTTTGIVTLSVYAKAGTINFLWLRGVTSSINVRTFFDLSNGTIGGDAAVSSKITDVGGGWYRCEATFNQQAGFEHYIGISDADGSASTSTTGYIYIQDAQLEQGLVATDYIETGASTAQAGILEDMPRLDYSGGASCPSLLLEPQRTNIALYNSDINTNWNMVANVTNAITQDVLSPEGVYNAWSARRNVNTSGYTYMTALPLAVNTTYTASIWLKANDLSVCDAVVFNFHPNSFSSKSTILSFEDGSVTGDGVVEPYPNGWYRVSLTSTSNASIGYFDVGLQPLLNGDVYWGGSDGDVLWYAYGTQVEQGSYPTSYIPTYGTSQTRSKENSYKASISDLIGQEQGTLFAEVDISHLDGTTARDLFFLSNTDNVSDDWIGIGFSGVGSNTLRGRIVDSGSLKFDQYGTISSTGRYKIALAYENGNGAFYVNGVSFGTNYVNTNFSLTLDRIFNAPVGFSSQFADDVKQLLVFPTRLTNAELAALTTI